MFSAQIHNSQPLFISIFDGSTAQLLPVKTQTTPQARTFYQVI